MKNSCPNENTAFYKTINGFLGKEKAYEIHIKVESDRFNKWYGKGKRDSFGYPKLIDDIYIENGVGEKISIYEFDNTNSFNISEKNRKSRDKISNDSKKAKNVLSKMKDVLLIKIRMYREKGGQVKYDKEGNIIKSPYIQKIEELLNDIQIAEEKDAVLFFVDNAIKEIEIARKKMNELILLNDEEIKDFSIIRNYVSAYDILDEIRLNLSKDPKVDKSYIDNLDRAIVDRNQIKALYMEEIKIVNAKFYSKLSYKNSEEELLDLFEVAPTDVSLFSRYGMYAGSSKDTLLGLLGVAVNKVNSKTRKEHIPLVIELNNKLEKLEKVKNTSKPTDLFNEILEVDKEGNLTGHYISEYNVGGFKKERKEFFDILNKQFESGEISEKVKKSRTKKWFSDNVLESGQLKDKWKSKKFIELQEHRKNGTNKELVDFYDFFVKTYEDMQKLIPEFYAMGTQLPAIRKEFIDRLVDNKIEDTYDTLKETISDMYTRKEGDNNLGEIINETGEIVNKIPIYFTGNLPVNEMSFDLGHLLKAFSGMALNYNNMTEVLDVLESTGEILKNREILRTTSTGEKIKNAIKGLENNDTYTKGIDSNIYKQYVDFMQAHVYGKTSIDLGYFDFLGIKKLDVNKVLNSISGYTVKNLLAGNVLNEVSNKTLGEVTNWIEAGAEALYGKKEYLDSIKIYNENIYGIISDVGQRTVKNKINVVGDWLNVYQDYRGSINENTNRSKYKKLLNSNSLFLGMKAGEHSITSKVMIAALKKIQPLHNGKPIEGLETMWDAIDSKDGKFIVDERVTNFGKDEQDDFSMKVQETLRRNHGNFSNETAVAWQRNAIMRLAGSLRRHLIPGYLRRFESKRDNQFLKSTTEGNYRTTARFLKQIVIDLKQMQIDLLKEDWENLDDYEKQNIKRTIWEVGFLITTTITIAVLSKLKGDDDEDMGDKTKLFLAYQANRLNLELRAYVNPLDTWKILKSPAASMSTIESIIKLTDQLAFNPTERYLKGDRKGELKLIKQIEKLIPIYRQFRKLSNKGLDEAINWYQNGSTK